MRTILTLLLFGLCLPLFAETQEGDKNGYKVFVDSAATTTPLTNIGDVSEGPEDIAAQNFAIIAQGRPPFTVDTLADLQTIATANLIDGQRYRTRGYTTTTDSGGMEFIYFDEGLTAAGGADSPLRIAGPAAGDDYFRAFDSGFGIVSTKALGLTQANSIIQAWAYNTIDDVGDAVLLGGSTVTPNGIGDTSVPAGTDFTPGNGAWATDSGYVDNSANFAAILSGYDSRNNQLAGCVIGNHHFLKYNATGHSAIIAGSYCLNEAGRSNIFGGHNSAITDATTVYSAILGGSNIEVDDADGVGVLAGHSHDISESNYVGTVGGFDNDISSTSPYSGTVGGTLHSISGSAGAVILGGYDIDVATSAYSASAGYQHDVTGSAYSFTAGRTNLNQDAYTAVVGRDAESLGDNSIVLGKQQLSTGGRSQSHIYTTNIRTNSASPTNLVSFCELDDTKTTAGLVDVKLVAMRDGSADGENDNTYTYSCWQTTFTVFWDGTTWTIGSSAGAPADETEPFSTAVYDGFGGTVTPVLALSNGSLRVNVTGIADTDIEWTATIEFTQLTID